METAKWTLDAAHSELQFKVRHMMISNVTGYFQKFDATVEMDGTNVETAKVSFTGDVSSLSTNNEQRDGHLRSADFFDAENHPQIKFEGDKLVKKSGDDYELTGNLTMRGTTKPITLQVEFGGIIKDPYGNDRAGFTVEGKINRKDFGLNWNALTETGGVVVSDEVKLHANVQFTKAK